MNLAYKQAVEEDIALNRTDGDIVARMPEHEIDALEAHNDNQRIGLDDQLKARSIYEKLHSAEVSGTQRADLIRSHYKELAIGRLIESGNIAELSNPDWVFPADLAEQMQAELSILDAEYTHNGVHFLKCQFSDILAAYHRGDRVEFEAFGPYLRDYIFQLFGGPEGIDYSKIELTNIDAVGLALMQLIRGELPDAHPISLYDEYNLGVTASDPVLGTPVNRDNATGPNGIKMERGQLAVASDIYYAEFRKFVEGMLRYVGAIKDGEAEGADKDFVLLSETEKIEDAKKLVEVLRAKWLIYEKGEEIWFRNTISNCWDPRYLRIKLRDDEGKWQCAALDASGFLDERNRDITHLVILPKENFEEQQDQVWEILRVLGISPRNYHNIHFDADVTPEGAVRTFREVLGME